jgi:hypothetical protein
LIVAAVGVFVAMGLMTAVAGAKQRPNAPKPTAGAPFQARGSVGEVYVVNAEPGDKLMLVSSRNKVLRTGVADSFGSELFYFVKPGPGYSVRLR